MVHNFTKLDIIMNSNIKIRMTPTIFALQVDEVLI